FQRARRLAVVGPPGKGVAFAGYVAGRFMAGVSLAETFQIALCDRRQSLARERAGFWSVDDVFERSGDEHLPDAGVAGGDARHLVQDGEAAVDLLSGGAVLLD